MIFLSRASTTELILTFFHSARALHILIYLKFLYLDLFILKECWSQLCDADKIRSATSISSWVVFNELDARVGGNLDEFN